MDGAGGKRSKTGGDGGEGRADVRAESRDEAPRGRPRRWGTGPAAASAKPRAERLYAHRSQLGESPRLGCYGSAGDGVMSSRSRPVPAAAAERTSFCARGVVDAVGAIVSVDILG